MACAVRGALLCVVPWLASAAPSAPLPAAADLAAAFSELPALPFLAAHLAATLPSTSTPTPDSNATRGTNSASPSELSAADSERLFVQLRALLCSEPAEARGVLERVEAPLRGLVLSARYNGALHALHLTRPLADPQLHAVHLPLPFDETRTYAQYYLQRWGLTLTCSSQPLLTTQTHPKQKKSEGAKLPRALRLKLHGGAPVLVPELCAVLPHLSGALVFMAPVLALTLRHVRTVVAQLSAAMRAPQLPTLRDVRLLKMALTTPHFAHAAELSAPIALRPWLVLPLPPHSQALEYLGDALLELVAATLLYAAFPRAAEAELSWRKSRLCRNKHLARVAQRIGLPALLLTVSTPRGAAQTALGADALEALLGALFLDAGADVSALHAVHDFCVTHIVEALRDGDDADWSALLAASSTRDAMDVDAAPIYSLPRPLHACDTAPVSPACEAVLSELCTWSTRVLGKSTWREPRVLLQVFVSASVTHAGGLDGMQSYERLEWLGDAVLKALTAAHLFTAPRDAAHDASAVEAHLTLARTAWIMNATLARASERLALPTLHVEIMRALLTSVGHECALDAASLPLKTKADLFEALLGALVLDGGLVALAPSQLDTVPPFLTPHLFAQRDLCPAPSALNPKGLVQELVQRAHPHAAPHYDFVADEAEGEKGARVKATLRVHVVDARSGAAALSPPLASATAATRAAAAAAAAALALADATLARYLATLASI